MMALLPGIDEPTIAVPLGGLDAFFFAVGFTYEYHLPQIESWLLVKIERLRPSILRFKWFPRN